MAKIQQPKKQDDVSIQDLYKAVLGLTKKLDKIVDNDSTKSNSLKYIQEQKANTEAINKLTKKIDSFETKTNKTSTPRNEAKTFDLENKRLAAEKKKQDIRLKEEKARRDKELFELKKKRELELAKHDAEIHQREIKERYGNRYKDTTAYRVGADIASQKSNMASALTVSALTGGLVNPVIAEVLGLDKLVTSTAKFAGRTVGNGIASIGSGVKKTAMGTLNAISGLGTGALDGLNQMRLGIGKAADNRIKARHTRAAEGITAETSDNAVALDKAQNDPIVKNQQTLLGWLRNRFGDKASDPEKQEEKKESLFDKILSIFGGLSGIAKGLGFAALPMLIKHLWPDFVKKVDEKFKNFLADKGLSESTIEGVDQLVKDALPGALFGLASGGFKGAIIGAGLTLAGNYLKRKWDEWHGNAENETTPKTVGPIPLNYVEAAIAGATIGSLAGFKGTIIGALIGIAGQGLWDLGNKFGEWTAGAINWLTEAGASPMTAVLTTLGIGGAGVAAITKAVHSLPNIIKGFGKSITNAGSAITNGIKNKITANLGAVSKGLKSLGSAALKLGAGLAAFEIGRFIGKKLGLDDENTYLGKKVAKAGESVGDKVYSWYKKWKGNDKNDLSKLSPEELNKIRAAHGIKTDDSIIKPTGKETFDISVDKGKYFYNGKDVSSENLHNLIQQEWNNWQMMEGAYKWNDKDYAKFEEQYGKDFADEMYKEHLEDAYNEQVKDLIRKSAKRGEAGAGGYGSIGQLSQTNDKVNMIHGRQAVGLKDLSLRGSVVSSNSIPYIAEGNKESLQNLDRLLNEWGYEIVYTSAMGGHRPGTGHWKGNKIDLQLKKNGRPAHLTPAQLNVLRKAGYWGPGTGALGWEPVSGQVGGGHYDLYVANGSSSGTALASAGNLRLDTQDMPTTAENQYVAMNNMNETTMASVEANANSSGGIMDMLGSIGNSIDNGFNSMSSSSNDGMSAVGGAIGGGMPNIAMNIPNTNGGAGSSTGNVYAFGDVAKTPILYTL